MGIRVLDYRNSLSRVPSAAPAGRSGVTARTAHHVSVEGKIADQRPRMAVAIEAESSDMISQLAAVNPPTGRRMPRKRNDEGSGLGWGVLLCIGTVALAAIVFWARVPLSHLLFFKGSQNRTAPWRAAGMPSRAIVKPLLPLAGAGIKRAAKTSPLAMKGRSKDGRLLLSAPLPPLEVPSRSPVLSGLQVQAPAQQTTKSGVIPAAESGSQPSFDPDHPPGAMFTGDQ